jgi:hypothetical protein
MTTHDYTKPCWGHNVSIMKAIDGGQQLRVCGWGHGVTAGDYVLLPNGDYTTRYRVYAIEYMVDPHDQWFAALTFAPREAVAA